MPTLALAVLLPLLPQVTVGPRPPAAVLGPVASVRVLEGPVEHGRRGGWKKEGTAFGLAPGERVRTGRDGLALMSLPWMEILVGNDSVVALAPSIVLATWLEKGRIEQRAPSQILKIATSEAVVRGRGSVVVRRSEQGSGITRVSSLDGTFAVGVGAEVVLLASGTGLVVRGGRPETVALPPAPEGLRPGRDPAYVRRGAPLALSWTGPAERYHLEVSSLSGDEVLLAREVTGRAISLPIEWLGTFRWRVSAVGEDGLEGLPSEPGYFCVVEK
ncbi:MAG TPA: hypothetical protein VMR21_13870 [Vicinamibacteria bacterium]|nr:hypothetical protein [Vicinamibacteria bacterium]